VFEELTVRRVAGAQCIAPPSHLNAFMYIVFCVGLSKVDDSAVSVE
jgi:hypothetical protein